MINPGYIAGVATACCWAACAMSFEAAGKRVGSRNVNIIRLALGFVFLTLFCSLWRGMALPLDAPRSAWLWLGLSGLVGFFLGDLCLFRSFLLIGARRSLLILSLAPPVTALTEWLVLGDVLTLWGWLGMGVTLAGVAWVIMERRRAAVEPPRDMSRGVALALVGAVAQGVGLVFARKGMQGWDQPFAATQIRMITAMAGFIVLFVAAGWLKGLPRALKDRRSMGLLTFGAFTGPFLGVSLWMLSVTYVKAGVAATLVATVPVIVIPPVIFIYKEKVSPRAWIGAIVTVIGVAVLCLGGEPQEPRSTPQRRERSTTEVAPDGPDESSVPGLEQRR